MAGHRATRGQHVATVEPVFANIRHHKKMLVSGCAASCRWGSMGCFTEGLQRGRRLPCYPSNMKVSEVLRMLQTDGWYLVATRGSHRQFKHASKPGRVTVPGKPSDDLAPGTLNSIQKQAGLKS
jgi:predicted RNA binding protein YcfA (HicA-like mRNA interferase family)